MADIKKIKSVAHSSRGNHIGQLDFCKIILIKYAILKTDFSTKYTTKCSFWSHNYSFENAENAGLLLLEIILHIWNLMFIIGVKIVYSLYNANSMAYGTRRFNASFTRESIHSPLSSRSILILSSHLRLGLSRGLFLYVYLLTF